MTSPFDVPPDGRVGGRGSIIDVPASLWAYGLLRALAFVAPVLTTDGRIGLGVLVVPVLYVFVLRRSRVAYNTLVFLDGFSAVMLLTVWLSADDNPLSIPILTGLSLLALLWPSNRRYVTAPANIRIPPAPSSNQLSHRTTKGY